MKLFLTVGDLVGAFVGVFVFGVGVFGVALALSGVLVAVLTAPDKTKKRAAASPGKIKISYYTYPPASAASAARSFAWSRSGQ